MSRSIGFRIKKHKRRGTVRHSQSMSRGLTAQIIRCDIAFRLYIRGSPHQARERFVARPEAGFLSPRLRGFGGALFLENAHD
jgi:hypothetical protein